MKTKMKFVVNVSTIDGLAVVQVTSTGSPTLFVNNKPVGRDFLSAMIQCDLLTFLRDKVGRPPAPRHQLNHRGVVI